MSDSKAVEPAQAASAKAVDDQLIDELVGPVQAEGLPLTGEGGLPQQLTKRLPESALEPDHRRGPGPPGRGLWRRSLPPAHFHHHRQGVLEGMTASQSRSLDAVHPVAFIDAIHVKIRDGAVANRPGPRGPRRHHRGPAGDSGAVGR
ncbi:hypothetical protein Shyhy02_42240 [Streptomyces hygroscopicus subsp. hygroscopicus]|nr:hypothetical protein Shyhy02_42240 [Streptomyces hygroscopicus subsp. hygroscopicus]